MPKVRSALIALITLAAIAIASGFSLDPGVVLSTPPPVTLPAARRKKGGDDPPDEDSDDDPDDDEDDDPPTGDPPSIAEIRERLRSSGHGDIADGIESIINATANEQYNVRVSGLRRKRDTLQRQVTQLKRALDEFRDENGDLLDPEEVRKALAGGPVDDDKKRESKEWRNRIEEPLKRRITELESERDKLQADIERMVIDEQIERHLDEGNVNPKLKKGAKTLLRSKAWTIETDSNGGRQAVLDTGDSLMDVETVVSDFLASDEGRAYALAPDHAGGDRNVGGSDVRKRRKKTRLDPEENPWHPLGNLTERGRIRSKDPERADQLEKEAQEWIAAEEAAGREVPKRPIPRRTW